MWVPQEVLPWGDLVSYSTLNWVLLLSSFQEVWGGGGCLYPFALKMCDSVIALTRRKWQKWYFTGCLAQPLRNWQKFHLLVFRKLPPRALSHVSPATWDHCAGELSIGTLASGPSWAQPPSHHCLGVRHVHETTLDPPPNPSTRQTSWATSDNVTGSRKVTHLSLAWIPDVIRKILRYNKMNIALSC